MRYRFIIPPLFFLILIAVGNDLFAQRQKLISGSTRALKKERSLDIKFIYDAIVKSEMLDSGAVRFESAFLAGFQEYCHLKLGDKTASYTLIVSIHEIKIGAQSTSLIADPATIAGDISINDSKNSTDAVAKIEFYDFSRDIPKNDKSGAGRVKSAFEWAGKGIGNYLAQKLK